jgi:hypothetical protein
MDQARSRCTRPWLAHRGRVLTGLSRPVRHEPLVLDRQHGAFPDDQGREHRPGRLLQTRHPAVVALTADKANGERRWPRRPRAPSPRPGRGRGRPQRECRSSRPRRRDPRAGTTPRNARAQRDPRAGARARARAGGEFPFRAAVSRREAIPRKRPPLRQVGLLLRPVARGGLNADRASPSHVAGRRAAGRPLRQSLLRRLSASLTSASADVPVARRCCWISR